MCSTAQSEDATAREIVKVMSAAENDYQVHGISYTCHTIRVYRLLSVYIP